MSVERVTGEYYDPAWLDSDYEERTREYDILPGEDCPHGELYCACPDNVAARLADKKKEANGGGV